MAAKAALELGVGRAQRRLRIDLELARQIGGREQQIADLLEDFRRGASALAGRRLRPHRVARAAASRTSASSSATLSAVWPRVLEIESDARRALAELVGAHQRGQRLRHAVQRARSGVAAPRAQPRSRAP